MSAAGAVAFTLGTVAPPLRERLLLNRPVQDFLAGELAAAGGSAQARWQVDLGSELLFDRSGLALITRAVAGYRGAARRLTLSLTTDARTFADYYSLQTSTPAEREVPLPVIAHRARADPDVALASSDEARLEIALPVDSVHMPFPAALAAAGMVTVPQALLMPCRSDFDLLFANQIALLCDLGRRIRASPLALLGSLRRRPGVPWRMRAALSYRSVHPRAQIHPTAVIEGSVIGADARIGAHCVVRFSVIGAQTRLHDGAKVEYSVVGDGCWLMHDLVLYRCHVEDQVFLIHGPYQFSQFQSRSSAFATILMDYRPDGRPIRVTTPHGPRSYAGRFLGSVLKPGAKTLGGCLVAPGRTVAADTWLACPVDALHASDPEGAATAAPVPPAPRPGASRATAAT